MYERERLSGNDLRFIVEDRKYIYIFILNLIEKCISMIIASKMARKLFVYRKRKKREVKRIEKHCCELNRKVLFSSRLRKKKKKEITMSRKPRSFSIIALIFFVCRFATWLAGKEGRWLKFTGGWIKISRRFAFKKEKKKNFHPRHLALYFPPYN